MKRLITALVLASVAGLAAAQTATPGVDRREARQQARIAQGVASGELTARETARLERGEARIERMEGRAKADGVVTAGERGRLQHAENVESRRIFAQKHDAQRR